MSSLITDRSQADVLNNVAKGNYNQTDLNRVELATKELAELLTSLGYPVTLSFKLDWEREDFPTASEMNRYLNNVKMCVKQYANMPGALPLPASMANLDWRGANAIEQTIFDLNKLIKNMELGYRGSNCFYAGSDYGLRGYVL